MATAVEPTQAFRFADAQSVMLYDIPYRLYVELADAVGDSHVRFTYDRGALEIMTLSPEHEIYKKLFAQAVQALAEELDLPLYPLGSTTFRREDRQRGLEPDECFYLTNWERVAGKPRIDLKIDPPPDLAIEVDITRRSIQRQSIYAALGVPEIWRYRAGVLTIATLQPDDTYASRDRSPTFPSIPPEGLVAQIEKGRGMNWTVWTRGLRAWVRAQIAAR